LGWPAAGEKNHGFEPHIGKILLLFFVSARPRVRAPAKQAEKEANPSKAELKRRQAAAMAAAVATGLKCRKVRCTNSYDPNVTHKGQVVKLCGGCREKERKKSIKKNEAKASAGYERPNAPKPSVKSGEARAHPDSAAGKSYAARLAERRAQRKPKSVLTTGDERAASVNLTLTRGWCAGRAATGSYSVPSSRHRAL